MLPRNVCSGVFSSKNDVVVSSVQVSVVFGSFACVSFFTFVESAGPFLVSVFA